MPSTLAREVARLKARRPSRLRAVSADRVEFAARQLGIEPDDWQCEFLSSDSPRILLNCSRQSGKSTMAAIRALHEALTKPGSLVLILAPAERQARECFAKAASFYRSLGHAPSPDSDRRMGMELANGSRIEALPGTEKTVRGFSGVDLLILDEAARVLDDLYHAARPMLAVSGGTLMMLSTPFGKRGVFYEEWVGASSWERYEVPAPMCPRISPVFLEEERRSLPDRVFRQEYLCSFEDTEGQVFSEESIQAAITDEIEPLTFEGAELAS
jgi:phage FluMu gp28-like protein